MHSCKDGYALRSGFVVWRLTKRAPYGLTSFVWVGLADQSSVGVERLNSGKRANSHGVALGVIRITRASGFLLDGGVARL